MKKFLFVFLSLILLFGAASSSIAASNKKSDSSSKTEEESEEKNSKSKKKKKSSKKKKNTKKKSSKESDTQKNSKSSDTKLTDSEKKKITVEKKEITSKSDLKDNVKEYRGSYVIKNIPMIDQGNQPKCVPCTLRRLLDYYAGGDAKVSQSAIEKALGYSKETGTNYAIMAKALEKYSRQLKMQYEQLYYAYDSDGICEQYLQAYNATAPDKKKVEAKGGIFKNQMEYEALLSTMDYDSWKKAKMADKRSKDIQKTILKNVKSGYPLMWSVTLGLYKDSHSKANKIGGHCRLIIGFDPKEEKIYYSDSWGNGHQQKSMSWQDAWAITCAISLVRP